MGENNLLLIHQSQNDNWILKIYNDVKMLALFNKITAINCDNQFKTDFVNDCVISKTELRKK